MLMKKLTRVAGLFILTCTETKNMLALINKEICRYIPYIFVIDMSAKKITGYIEESYGKTCGDL